MNYKSAQKDYEAFINDSKKEDPEFLKFKIEEIENFILRKMKLKTARSDLMIFLMRKRLMILYLN